MPETLQPSLQQKLEERLRYYEDLGIRLFYRDRSPSDTVPSAGQTAPVEPPPADRRIEETPLPKRIVETPAKRAPRLEPVMAPPDSSLFEAVDRVQDDTLLKIQQDIGRDCTRCKLHKARHTIVFGDGSANAKLVFVG